MPERMKTWILIALVLSSMILTYRVWFGSPPLDDGKTTGYEYLYFAEPYLPAEIVTPAEIIFVPQAETDEINDADNEVNGENEDKTREEHVFRPGEEQYRHLREKGVSLLKNLKYQDINRISEEDKDVLTRSGAARISFNFSVPLPIAFLVPELTSSVIGIRQVVFISNGDNCLVFLEGDETLTEEISMSIPNEEAADFFSPPTPNLYYNLPDVLVLDTNENENENESQIFQLELKSIGGLRIPSGDLQAAEIVLEREQIDRDQLVKALFFDQSMARRIEERDGAVFFTDGEKGLRIYPDGLIEYTAPKLEQSLLSISFNTALQKGAENLSLFGGWFPETYLTGAEKQPEGYLLSWKNYFDGLPLQGENAGSEMGINDQGVYFYQRNFYNLLGEAGEKKSFRPYTEALTQAAILYKEFTQRENGLLLEIEPVYFLSQHVENGALATPAWAVAFEGMDKLYLHWQTLQPIAGEVK